MASPMKRKLEPVTASSETKSPKLTTTFTAAFRKKLKTDNAINILKEFNEANKERDVVTEYINAGGSAKELLSLMKQFDGKKDLIVANTVLSALQSVVSKSITDLLLIQKNVEEACEELLCTYQVTMQSMLCSSPSTTSHRKVILRLFTGMVTLNPILAKRLLSLFPVNSKTLKILTDSRSSSSAQKLRTCFIHYLMSFLVDGNALLISELLKKKGLLTSIIPGLVNDYPETVVLVLNSLRLKIVENIRISKTQKMHTFSTPVLCSLAKLYDYNLKEENSMQVDDSMDNVELVRSAVHALLVLLTTSSKKGILFAERSLISGKSPNQLIFTLLENIELPWKDPLKCDLVTEILKVCPEFIKSALSSLDHYILPSVSEDWINCINFVKLVISKQEFNCETLSQQQSYNTIIATAFPAPLLKLVHDLRSDIIHDHPMIRFHVASLLLAALTKVQQCLNRWAETFPERGNTFKCLKLQIDQFLNKNLIPCSNVLNAWKAGVQKAAAAEEDAFEVPEITQYSAALVDLLILYNELCPLNFTQLQSHQTVVRLPTEGVQDPELLFKIAHLIFRIHNPKPGQEQFAFMMTNLLKQYVNSEEDNLREEEDIIRSVFLSTGFFDGFEEEIIVWLSCMKRVGAEYASVVSDLIVSVFGTLAEKRNVFTKDLEVLATSSQEECNLSEEVLSEEYENLLEANEDLEPAIVRPVHLSPVLPAYLYTLKRASLSDGNLEIAQSFSASVLVHLLHTQFDNRGLKTLLDKYNDDYVSSKCWSYVQFWDTEMDTFDYPLPLDDAIFELGSVLAEEDDSGHEIWSLIERADTKECVLLWNMCIFYAVQLNNRKSLDTRRVAVVIRVLELLSVKLQSDCAFCMKSLLTNYAFVNGFSVERDKSKSFLTSVVIKASLHMQKLNEKAVKAGWRFMWPYRLRFILSVLEKIKMKKRIRISSELFTMEDVLQFLALPGNTIIELLRKLVHFPSSMFLNEKQTKLSEWSGILECLLKEAAENLDSPLGNADTQYVMALIVSLLKINISTDSIEESFIEYLTAFPHHISSIDEDTISDLIVHHSSISKLGVFLAQYRADDNNWSSILQDTILENIHSVDVDSLLEVLSIVESRTTIDETVLSAFYKAHLTDAEALFEKQEEEEEEIAWLRKYTDLVVKIIGQFASKRKCCSVCESMASDWLSVRLDSSKCRVLRVFFEKASKMELYAQLLIMKFNVMLPAASKDVSWLCTVISDTILQLESGADFLLKYALWKEFVKLSLKFSLQKSDAELLRCFRIVCEKAFLKPDSYNEESSMIFQMMISHSEFINAMLSDLDVKCELLELWMVLGRVNKLIMSSNHVPLLLGAYKATLSKSDQLLFQLLRWYEDNGIRFTDCRPYLWGDAAVTHHSVRTEISVSLKRQPLPNQVLELLDGTMVRNTVKHFPLGRSLQPAVNKEVYEGEAAAEMYDLSFVLPLTSHLLAPESRISVQKFTRSGALALILCALSSEATDVRMAAYHCLQRFHFHLSSREKEIQLWDHFVNALKNGVLTIGCNSEENDNVPPRLPCIVTNFLAQMSLIISEPLHPLFVSLSNFLLAKPSFDISTVPNFLALFYSTEVKFREQQEWILNVIKYGMRYKSDWIVSQKCFLFKVLQQYYTSSISSEAINVLILDIVIASLRINECKQHIITKCGFVSWITQIVQHSVTAESSGGNRALLGPLVEIFRLLSSGKNADTVICVEMVLMRKLDSLNVDGAFLETLLGVFSQTYSACRSAVDVVDEGLIRLIIKVCEPFVAKRRSKQYLNYLTFRSKVMVVAPEGADRIDEFMRCILRRYLDASTCVHGTTEFG